MSSESPKETQVPCDYCQLVGRDKHPRQKFYQDLQTGTPGLQVYTSKPSACKVKMCRRCHRQDLSETLCTDCYQDLGRIWSVTGMPMQRDDLPLCKDCVCLLVSG